jgi:hypothetical protein
MSLLRLTLYSDYIEHTWYPSFATIQLRWEFKLLNSKPGELSFQNLSDSSYLQVKWISSKHIGLSVFVWHIALILCGCVCRQLYASNNAFDFISSPIKSFATSKRGTFKMYFPLLVRSLVEMVLPLLLAITLHLSNVVLRLCLVPSVLPARNTLAVSNSLPLFQSRVLSLFAA